MNQVYRHRQTLMSEALFDNRNRVFVQDHDDIEKNSFIDNLIRKNLKDQQSEKLVVRSKNDVLDENSHDTNSHDEKENLEENDDSEKAVQEQKENDDFEKATQEQKKNDDFEKAIKEQKEDNMKQ